MKNEEIILKTVPARNKRLVAFFLAIILVIIFSYFVPGWDYLFEVKTHLIQLFGLPMICFLLLSFYFLIFIFCYKMIFGLFSKKVVLKISEDQLLTFFVEGDGNFVISKNQLEIDKNIIKIRGEKNIDLLLKDNNKGALLQKILMKEKNFTNDSAQESFIGGVRSLFEMYIYFIFLLLIYILTAIFSYKFITPYIADLQILFRAKGALLMIISSLPFILIFVSVTYSFTVKIILGKNKVDYNFLNNGLSLSQGKKNFDLNKKEIEKTVFFINTVSGSIKYFVIYSKSKKNYLIYNKDNDVDFHNFINRYKILFEITEKISTTLSSSPKSIYYKETFYHE